MNAIRPVKFTKDWEINCDSSSTVYTKLSVDDVDIEKDEMKIKCITYGFIREFVKMENIIIPKEIIEYIEKKDLTFVNI